MTHPALEHLYRMLGLEAPVPNTTEARTAKRTSDTRGKNAARNRRPKRATVAPSPVAGDEAKADTDQ